jgi:polyhydroxyalkanoate synthesis regulator phasin
MSKTLADRMQNDMYAITSNWDRYMEEIEQLERKVRDLESDNADLKANILILQSDLNALANA